MDQLTKRDAFFLPGYGTTDVGNIQTGTTSFEGDTLSPWPSSLRSVNPNAEIMGKQAALFMNINAAKGLQDVMKSNLGPKGTIKMLVGGAGGERHSRPDTEATFAPDRGRERRSRSSREPKDAYSNRLKPPLGPRVATPRRAPFEKDRRRADR